MGIKERDKLNAPAAKSTPPARETGVVSHRDSIDMAPRHFVTSNHGIVISSDTVKTYNDSAFFPCNVPCRFADYRNLPTAVSRLFFREQSVFFLRFCERFLSLCGHQYRQYSEHPCLKSFCSVGAIRRSTAVQCTRFYNLGQGQFSRFFWRMKFPPRQCESAQNSLAIF